MEPSQAFSYRKFGVAFLLIAIVVAIILASVPAAVNTSHTLSTNKTGFLFFSLLAIFLLLLLSCLFCTYYLGGSRDTWEDPVFTGIRFNFSNTTAIIGLFVEFIQVCGFSFPGARFTGSDNLQNMLYLSLLNVCTYTQIIHYPQHIIASLLFVTSTVECLFIVQYH